MGNRLPQQQTAATNIGGHALPMNRRDGANGKQ